MIFVSIVLYFNLVSFIQTSDIVTQIGNQTLQEWSKCRGKTCSQWKAGRNKMQLLIALEARENNIDIRDNYEVNNLPYSDAAANLEDCLLLSNEQLDVLINNAMTGSTDGMQWGERDNSDKQRHKRAASDAVFSRWQMPIIWKFSGEHSQEERDFIRKAFQHWEHHTCVRFKEVGISDRINDHHIMVTKSPNGCYSYIGQVNLIPQPLNLATQCLENFGVAVHEIGHALGMWHEQQRTDRDDHIRVNTEFISGSLSQFVKKKVKSSVNLPYDMSSVMHYGPKALTNNMQENTLDALNPLLQHNMGQRVGLSHLNTKFINYAYCNGTCQSNIRCLRDGYQDPNRCNSCICPPAFSGRYCQSLRNHVIDPCGGELVARTSFSTIESPGFTGDFYYKNGQQCNWLLKAPSGYTLEVEFVSDFGLYSSYHEECFHWVQLNRGRKFSLNGPRFCGIHRPKGVIDLSSIEGSTSDEDVTEIAVSMRTSFSIPWHAMRRGFRLQYRAIDKNKVKSTTTTTTPAPSSAPSFVYKCANTDVVFLLDSSGSVKQENWAKVLLFIANYMDNAETGSDSDMATFRFSVVSFGTHATINIRLKDTFESKSSRRRRILSLEYKDQWTNTVEGIEKVTGILLARNNDDARLERRPLICILVTDGPANTPDSQEYTTRRLRSVAYRARREGVQFLTIGIGRDADAKELKEIVGRSYERNIGKSLFLWSYDQFSDKDTMRTVMQFTCESISVTSSHYPSSTTTRRSKPTTTTPPTTTTKPTTTTTTVPSTTTATTKKTPSTSGGNGKLLFSCDFEQNDFCGITQDRDDNFNWTPTSSATPSEPTGPKAAYSGNYFVFIETSNPRRYGDVARMRLHYAYKYQGVICLRFRYHMYGYHVQELRVSNNYNGKDVIVWRKLGNQGNRWYIATAEIDIRVGDQIVFTGIRGHEYSGDIGLDLIQLYTGQC